MEGKKIFANSSSVKEESISSTQTSSSLQVNPVDENEIRKEQRKKFVERVAKIVLFVLVGIVGFVVMWMLTPSCGNDDIRNYF